MAKNKKNKSSSLTMHSFMRFNERLGIPLEQQQKMQEEAFKYGYKISAFCGEFYDYVLSKQIDGGRYIVRVYNDIIFVFDQWYKRLITVYSVPKKYLPISQYLIRNNKETELISRYLIKITSPDNVSVYVGEEYDFVEDIALAAEFNTYQKAKNFVKNNRAIHILVKNNHTVEYIPM